MGTAVRMGRRKSHPGFAPVFGQSHVCGWQLTPGREYAKQLSQVEETPLGSCQNNKLK